MSTANVSSLRAKKIDHITIVVKDLERSTRFFAEVLGMDRIERPNFGFPGRWFQAGDTQIHMNVESEEAGQAVGSTESRGGSPTLASCETSRPAAISTAQIQVHKSLFGSGCSSSAHRAGTEDQNPATRRSSGHRSLLVAPLVRPQRPWTLSPAPGAPYSNT